MNKNPGDRKEAQLTTDPARSEATQRGIVATLKSKLSSDSVPKDRAWSLRITKKKTTRTEYRHVIITAIRNAG